MNLPGNLDIKEFIKRFAKISATNVASMDFFSVRKDLL